jgi:hypothetical protein
MGGQSRDGHANQRELSAQGFQRGCHARSVNGPWEKPSLPILMYEMEEESPGTSRPLGDQVEQREEINPDEVNQVPIQTNVVYWTKVLRVELTFSSLDQNPS